MEFALLFLIGISVGLVSVYFGIGGGVIMIPALYALFPDLPPASIIAISLGTIFLNSSLNNWRFYQMKLGPSQQEALWIFLSALAGALIGSRLVYALPAAFLKKILALVILGMALRMLFYQGSKAAEQNSPTRRAPLAVTCLFGALVSGVTGLGGGAVFVPFLLSFVKLPVNLVSSYSNMAMMAASLAGLLPHFFVPIDPETKAAVESQFFIGHVNALYVFCIFSGAFLSSRLGARLHAITSAATKKRLLTALLFFISLRIIIFG